MHPEFDYVVAFEAVDTSATQTYLRGEIEFHSLGLPLAERIRKILKPFEQESVPYQQSGIRPVPRKLWRINPDESRTLVDLPLSITQEDTAWEDNKRMIAMLIPVTDNPQF